VYLEWLIVCLYSIMVSNCSFYIPFKRSESNSSGGIPLHPIDSIDHEGGKNIPLAQHPYPHARSPHP
jgi:hypothetical protein